MLWAENDRAWAIGTDCILLRQNSGAMLLLDQSSIFDVPDKPIRLFRLGKEPLGEGGKERWYGIEDAAAVETSLNLPNGSAYISTACIFRSSGDKWMRPNSNFYYYVDGKEFVPVIRWWMEERGRTKLSTRIWQPIPWAEEVWQRKPYYDALMEIAADDWQYLPLDDDRYFLSSGDMLFLWDGDDLYRLEQMDSIAAAKWSYFERLDRDHLPLELVFEREIQESYKEIWLDCKQGQVFGVYQDLYTGQKYRFASERDLLYWSPMNDDGSRAEDVAIEFALLKGDDRVMDEDNIFLRGTITTTLDGTRYRNVQIELDGDLPDGAAVSVLDWEGKTLCRKAG